MSQNCGDYDQVSFNSPAVDSTQCGGGNTSVSLRKRALLRIFLRTTSLKLNSEKVKEVLVAIYCKVIAYVTSAKNAFDAPGTATVLKSSMIRSPLFKFLERRELIL